tara:strand:+ start:465 stop:656 length:192 start_codon:yes stop_codon:yes gene_type:complete
MTEKEKAIEICNNLKKTIKYMTKPTKVESMCSITTHPRAKKSTLETLKSKLMKRYNLTYIDLI